MKKPHSQEMKKKIAEGVKRFYLTNSIWNKGINHSINHREKISEGLKEYYVDNPVWNKGKKMGRIEKLQGRIPWNKGKKGVMTPIVWTKEMLEKQRQSQLGISNSNWKGGTSSEAKRIKGSSEWKHWRAQVFTRDNYTCQECGSHKYLAPHHIKPFSLYPELRFDIDNGKTLCEDCHRKTDTYGSKIQLRKRDELLGHPERTISSQAEKSEGSTVRGEIILTSVPHSSE